LDAAHAEEEAMAHTNIDLRAEGKWDQAKGRIKEAWGVLTDDELDESEGKWERVVGTIKEKTGETVDTIENKLHELFDRARDAGSN
jgi:uncharacterized protein YjbJ (UPF0337 family)